MSRKPFSKLLDWFYLHCADKHAVLGTKKGMIDVAVWTMNYVLLDNIDETDSMENMWKQFGTDFVSQHKCDGAHALLHSINYIRPILKQRVELRSDPGFTKKELYRRHNYAESNIHRGAGKRKVGKVISQLDPSKKITLSHPSSSSNATDSGADADIVAGGALSGAASETPVRSEVARADPKASTPKKSSTPRKGKNLNEGQRTDSNSDADIVAGGALSGAASETPVRSEVAHADPKASRRKSSPRLAAKAKASPSNQTVSSNITTPPIRNSKQETTQLHPTASGHRAVTTHAPPDVNAGLSSIDDSSIEESSSAISKDDSSGGSMSQSVFRASNLNGLLFCPSCTSSCITKSTDTMNPCYLPHNDVMEVALNDQGDFVVFPATTYHRGYYSHKKNHNTFFTAQFFCLYKSSDDVRLKKFSPKDDWYLKCNLQSSSVIGLFNDLRCYWDTYYHPMSHAPPKKYKLEDIDIARNRVVTRDQILNGRDFLLNIVLELEKIHPYLEVELVWFIRKSDDGHGFQDWHKDQVINGTTACTIVLNTGSYESTELTDDETDSSYESSSYTQPLTSFTLEGSSKLYFELDDAPLDSLVKLKLARFFYNQCKSMCRELLPIIGYDQCPRRLALKLDDVTRDFNLIHKDTEYDKDLFVAGIIKKTFPSLEGKPIRLPYFLDTKWCEIHRTFIKHQHFHRANIKLASTLEDFLERYLQKCTAATDDDAVYDDDEMSFAWEGALDEQCERSSTHTDISNTEAEEANDGEDARMAEDANNRENKPMTKTQKKTTTYRSKYCDWGEIGLCVVPNNPYLDKCQDSAGRCYNHIHHLCQIQYVANSGLPESTSITKLCRAHCPQYIQKMGTVQRKSPPETMILHANTAHETQRQGSKRNLFTTQAPIRATPFAPEIARDAPI